jgi:hypothetical protein
MRNIILDALATYLTSALVEEYGTGRICSRDPNDISNDTQGEQTPVIYIKEEARERPLDVQISQAYLELILFGKIKRQGYNEKLIQNELNNLEAFLDSNLATISSLGNIPCYVFQKPGQPSLSYAGQDEGWLEYHTTINYPIDL